MAVDVARRQRRLPAAKQQKYSDGIEELLKSANFDDNGEPNKRNLVKKQQVQVVLGRCLFAMQAGVTTMWPEFLFLLSRLATNWSDEWLRLHPECFACLVSLAQRERVELPGWDLERNTPWRNLKAELVLQVMCTTMAQASTPE